MQPKLLLTFPAPRAGRGACDRQRARREIPPARRRRHHHTSVLVLRDADGIVRARSEVAGIAAGPAFVAEVKALLASPQ